MRTLAAVMVLSLTVVQALAAPIHDASGKGDLAKVKALMAKDAKAVNLKDGNGATPLHFAVAGGHKAVVEYLLLKKADVNAKKNDGVTPLHVAASLGRTEIAKLLLAKGAKKDASDSKGRTPLTLAGEKGHVEMIDLLSGKAPTPKPGVKVVSIPKDAAVLRGGKKVAGIKGGSELKLGDIIENGKTGDLVIHIGDTAAIRLKPGAKLKLTKLTLEGDLDIRTDLQAGDALARVRALMGQSRFQMASPGAVIAVRGTAFALKVKGEENTVIVGEGSVKVSLPSDPSTEVEVLENERLVVKAGSLGQPEPVSTDDLDLIQEMLQEPLVGSGTLAGAGHPPTEEEINAMMQAAVDGNLARVKELIDANPQLISAHDMSARGNSGPNDFTPLHWAAWENRTEVVEFLLSKGADVNARQRWNYTPLYCAAMNSGRRDVAEMLMKAGADVNAGEKDGITALHQAAMNGDLDLGELLIKHGANVNAAASGGWTPLFYGSNLDLCSLLLAKGANVNARSTRQGWGIPAGSTPLKRAITQGNTAWADLLRKYGGVE